VARKKTHDQLTPLELDIMKTLWDSGPSTVQAVQHHLHARDLAYTTVQTMLNVLLRKGKVRRSLKDRAYLYRPAVTRQRVVAHTIKDLVDRLFGGSAESLVMSMVQTRHISTAELARVHRLLDDSEE
jgi:predicted transcriptional regulator